jgi:hypothetical protein
MLQPHASREALKPLLLRASASLREYIIAAAPQGEGEGHGLNDTKDFAPFAFFFASFA